MCVNPEEFASQSTNDSANMRKRGHHKFFYNSVVNEIIEINKQK